MSFLDLLEESLAMNIMSKKGVKLLRLVKKQRKFVAFKRAKLCRFNWSIATRS